MGEWIEVKRLAVDFPGGLGVKNPPASAGARFDPDEESTYLGATKPVDTTTDLHALSQRKASQ